MRERGVSHDFIKQGRDYSAVNDSFPTAKLVRNRDFSPCTPFFIVADYVEMKTVGIAFSADKAFFTEIYFHFSLTKKTRYFK